MDAITLQRIQLVHPMLRDELTEIYQEICKRLAGRAMCRFTHTLRTFAEQNALHAIGRRNIKGERPVTWAKGGQSYHNYGLAVDICLIIDGKEASWNTVTDFDRDGIADWMEVVAVFKQFGWEWGGSWARPKTDMPHFQKTMGYKISQLQALYAKGNLTNGYLKLA